MCGIIGYIGSQDPKDILFDGLRRLEYRGYDSAGIAILEGEAVNVLRSAGRLARLEEKVGPRDFRGSIGLGHTRWATHGAPTELNAHPHRAGAITLVHNGIIENYVELRAELMAEGRTMLSETDSEVVAHLFDREIQKGRGLVRAVSLVLPRLKGHYAFVLLNEREPDLLVGVRNGAPLLVGLGDGETFLASDVQAVLHRTNKVIYLKDREVAVCTREKIHFSDIYGKEVSPIVKTIDWKPDELDKGGYRHYMLKEIHEQPIALARTIAHALDADAMPLKALSAIEAILPNLRRIEIVACGTARHAGLVGREYFERLAHLPVDVDFGSEFRYRDPVLLPGTLGLFISQSGETADTLAALREAKARGIPTVSICNVQDSSLTQESDVVIYTQAGPEIGVASTKAFTTQLAALYLLALELGTRRGTLAREKTAALTQDLLRLPSLIEQTLSLETEIKALAQRYQDASFFFYLGRGALYPIALEGALKLKEISYLHAEGYPAGELKHGPIALIDSKTVVFALAPRDRDSENADLSTTVHEKLLSAVQEVKSRGAKVIGVGTVGDPDLLRESVAFLGVPSAHWGQNPILASVPMQLFAYYVALYRGTDVDKPRNLAKSVTVE